MSFSPLNVRNSHPELTSEFFWRIVEISGLGTHDRSVINEAEKQEIINLLQ